MTEAYFVEVIVNKNCKCLKLKEAFFLIAESKEDAEQQVTKRFKMAKDIEFYRVIPCRTVKPNMFSLYTEFI